MGKTRSKKRQSFRSRPTGLPSVKEARSDVHENISAGVRTLPLVEKVNLSCRRYEHEKIYRLDTLKSYDLFAWQLIFLIQLRKWLMLRKGKILGYPSTYLSVLV